MSQPDDAKEYSHKWVTADELLCTRPCEICMVMLTCDGGNCNVIVYDGENTNGEVVFVLKALQNRTVDPKFHHHIYCRRGLYVVLSPAKYGVFVQWLERPQGIGYPK